MSVLSSILFISSLSLPLFSFLFLALFGWKLGWHGSCALSLTASAAALTASLVLLITGPLTGGPDLYLDLGVWVFGQMSGWGAVRWEFVFDPLTGIMFAVVTLISLCVQSYSIGYMANDPHRISFLSYLSFFCFFMLILVSGGNFLVVFVGWEGVGLCSFLLIGFWSSRPQAIKAALKALIINRIGDFFVIAGVAVAWTSFGSVNFMELTLLASPLVSNYDLTAAGLFLLIGVMGKSAQIGLHTWLPDAMEGPTPVSALIHAATMVTAGIFLIVRASPFFVFSGVEFYLVIVGSISSLAAGLLALLQNDLKKIIAYSTCSQLGYMVLACGLSMQNIAIFHLTTHAVFKSLLFLAAGAIIHAMGGEQDIRRMGGLLRLLPVSCISVLVGLLSLSGLPFLSGFYSKEAILLALSNSENVWLSYGYFAGFVSAVLTSAYSVRLFYMVFCAAPRAAKLIMEGAAESRSLFIMVPLLGLSALSVVLGYLLRPFFLRPDSPIFDSIVMSAYVDLAGGSEDLENKMVLFFLIVICFVFLLRRLLVLLVGGLDWLRLDRRFFSLVRGLCYRFYIDQAYNWAANKCLVFAYRVVIEAIDRGVLEVIGPYGITNVVWIAAKQVDLLHSGRTHHYMFLFLFNLVFITAIAEVSYFSCLGLL